MIKSWLPRYGWLLAWLLILVTSYLTRNLMPIDETRYVGVAWEMWVRGDMLVPHMNGLPYSHKPPLMFWLFNAGWKLFGVSEWWPRLVPPLFALVSLFLTRRMATILWPARPQVALHAPWILCASLLWAVFTGAVMFDMLLVAAVMLGLLGILHVATQKSYSGWLLVGVAAGLGILTKGPVVLLHIAFPALLGPWWTATARQQPLRWYGAVIAAVGIAAAIGLAWALPAAAAGGPAYEQALLWHQTADRLVSSFAHNRPFWWYLPLLPLLLSPWLLWPPLWRAFADSGFVADPINRFLLCWLLPTFVAFSLISGKQMQYLLPLFPGFALLAARALDTAERAVKRTDQLLPALLFLALGLALLLLPLLPLQKLPDWARAISPWWGAGILLVAAWLLAQTWKRASDGIITLAIAGTALTLLLMGGVLPAARAEYDPEPAARFIGALQEQGAPVANTRTYHDQFQFLGRLKQPLAIVTDEELAAWGIAHPDGYVVTYSKAPPEQAGPQPLYIQRYRGHWLTVWPVSQTGN